MAQRSTVASMIRIGRIQNPPDPAGLGGSSSVRTNEARPSTESVLDPDQLFALVGFGVSPCPTIRALERAHQAEGPGDGLRGLGPRKISRNASAPIKHGFGLAVNRQDKTGVGIFQGVEHFRKIAVKFTTANEANARLRASDSSRPKIGREHGEDRGEQTGAASTCDRHR